MGFRPEPVQENVPEQAQVTLPPRLTPVRIQSFITTPEPQTTRQTQRPSRREIITDRPNIRNSAEGSRFQSSNRFGSGSNRFQATQAPTTTTTAPTTTEAPKAAGLPDPVKAASGPNGEEYYYYYYYYDDDEAAEEE